ncbi:hypothetical protein F7C95_13705 [Opitutia bacterium ISCC 51]|nr:hypothetical protein F7C95_13705 [Opitutae bacterium ISCC 51]QXD27061.1 hypothetical protein GA003_13625 [Opitutae bacterium ISCC 52]
MSHFRFLTVIISLVCFVHAHADWQTVDDFDREDSRYHGHGWETLSPGYWKLEDQSLRRRLKNLGNRNPITNYPWHWSHGGKEIENRMESGLPDLPMGMIWRRDWSLTGNYSIRAAITLREINPEGRGEKGGYFGLAFGGESLFESREYRGAPKGASSWMAIWEKDGAYKLTEHGQKERPLEGTQEVGTPIFNEGDELLLTVKVHGDDRETSDLTATLEHDGRSYEITKEGVNRAMYTDGYLGLAAYGALDFEVNKVEIDPGENAASPLLVNDLHVAYPLGDSLKKVGEDWTAKFIALFRSDGKKVSIRIADTENPRGGWEQVPVAGEAAIVDNEWRRFTSVVDVILPSNPAEKELYYTIWKDGVDVTQDPRKAPREDGYFGRQDYVGRLPQLTAPYKLATLSCHALHHNGSTLPENGTYQRNWIHGQPIEGAYEHFEDFGLQVLNWEDDVWYLELIQAPPSTDDAYKVITLSIANPTSRWQMMRHWNVINPGDHDYGMDDVKGPEQIMVRKHDDLGQDPLYMQRNFSINHHLIQGTEHWIGTENPKDWRQWKMPNGDFSLVVLESRLWRSSQDTNVWTKQGWGHKKSLYDRRDVTRTLLGEEQFGWFQELVRTDTSPLIMVSGVNCMFPIFKGGIMDPELLDKFGQEDRIAADYSGWVTAGIDRIVEVMGARPGMLSVYGDIHLGSVVENKAHRIIEASCGPIGRNYGGRAFKNGFGREMVDYDGREVTLHALYCGKAINPDLELPAADDPQTWNFLETIFDPRPADPVMTVNIRNIIDAPGDAVRGGGPFSRVASSTGRFPQSSLPSVKTLSHADVHIRHADGRPILGTRSLKNGRLPVAGLPDIPVGTQLLLTAVAGSKVDSQLIKTVAVE